MTSSEPISVRLVPAAEKALRDTMQRTGYNRTDTINRALQVYDAVNRMPVGATLTITAKDVNETPYITHRHVWRGRRRSPGRL
jgi:hypothetical protein